MLKIKDIIQCWKNEKAKYVKQSTISAYTLMINKHILPAFGEVKLVSNKKVQDFVLQKFAQGYKPKTIKDILVILKMIIKFGEIHHQTAHVEFNIKFPPAKEKPLISTFCRADYKKLLAYVQNNFTFKNLGICICLLSGLRIGEICGLKWQDVNIKESTITITRTIQRIYSPSPNGKKTKVIIGLPKTQNSVREVPISSTLSKLLNPLKRVVNNNYYIITNAPTPCEPKTYRDHYNKIVKALGIQKLKFHAIRHSFATRCIESNCDYKTVSAILGHANISTTLNLYVHPNSEQKKKCVDQMWKKLK